MVPIVSNTISSLDLQCQFPTGILQSQGGAVPLQGVDKRYLYPFLF